MTLTTSNEPATGAGPGALSCFTANLATYLERTVPDPSAVVARSVRLAVRVTPGAPVAFSHHATDLGSLGSTCFLRYAAAPQAAEFIERIDELLRTDGQALVVTYAGPMSWSLAEPADSAPHFVRITAREGDRWEIDDRFSALLPAGVQQPFRGEVETTALLAAATAPAELPPEQGVRKEHALGVPVPVPAGGYQWLAPTGDPAGTGAVEPPGWLIGTLSVIDHLTAFYGDFTAHPERARLVDDMWAAAQHHAFRYHHLLNQAPLSATEREAATSARRAWEDLPLALFYAANAAARGKPRPGVVPKAFGAVREGEQRCEDLLRRHGYGDGT
jgi:hypothetical protein